MGNDNTTPLVAKEYDQKISHTIPYLRDFYNQTIDVVAQCKFPSIHWLDLGCGTGAMEELALLWLPKIQFTLLDASEKMIDQAKAKLKGKKIEYLCMDSTDNPFENCFEVVTAIQVHHYMKEEKRRQATERAYRALKNDGIYISFENVIPEGEETKAFELLRWGAYQQKHGKTPEEARAHNARCGVNYFPLTVQQHISLLRQTGFRRIHVFWYSYMQMGIYGIK